LAKNVKINYLQTIYKQYVQIRCW